jgi:broad specificity phosphatase PhoE
MCKRLLFILCLLISLTASSQTYYIVRHGEKATVAENPDMMANDPTLSAAGKARAIALKELLKGAQIGHIFSTNTIRTRTTAEPTSQLFNINIETYNSRPDAAFIDQLKSLKKNTLIVGHSNTVDDIVNMLCGEQKIPGDLADAEYDNLFVVTIKDGKATLEKRKFMNN